MIGRRTFMGFASAGLAATSALGQSSGKLHALNIGINAYAPISPLFGCINDVRLVGDSLRNLGARVTTLTDRAATRAGFLQAWRHSTAPLRSGDTFIFHFAGHGARLPAALRSSPHATSGDFLLFQSYHGREFPGERLLDVELHASVVALHRRGIAVVVLLDCCFAGSLTRGLGLLDDRPVRLANVDSDDILAGWARTPPPPAPPPPPELEEILFFAAGRQNEVVPEVVFEGRSHGALSVGFATAIAGVADANRDGTITRGELYDHIRITSQALASSQQEPVMQPADRGNEPLLLVPRSEPALAPPSQHPVRVAIRSMPAREGESLVRAIAGTIPVTSGWDLLWDASTRQALGPSRDVIAHDAKQSLLPALVERVRAERRLADLATTNRSIALRLTWPRSPTPGAHDNESHPEGRELLLRLAGERHPYLMVFNIAGATVQMVLPGPGGRHDGGPEGFDAMRRAGTCVKPPFGFDLVVALVTERPLPSLLARLNELHEQPLPHDLVPLLEAAVVGMQWQIGLQTIVTRPSQGEPREGGCPR